MKFTRVLIAGCCFAGQSLAATLPFDLSIRGAGVAIEKRLQLSDVGGEHTAINFPFAGADGKQYVFDLNYKALPSNRSYPTNLDITVKDADGKKLGYLFWANNGVEALHKIGTFGLMIDVGGELMDVRFEFDADKSGSLSVNDLAAEPLVQDTLMPKYGFQMIRPVLAPLVGEGVRSKSFNLDQHPYAVNYTLKDIDQGKVEIQYNLYRNPGENQSLMERVYYHADSIDTLREGMFAGKYFDAEAGTFKLVYYPALGQTEPAPGNTASVNK